MRKSITVNGRSFMGTNKTLAAIEGLKGMGEWYPSSIIYRSSFYCVYDAVEEKIIELKEPAQLTIKTCEKFLETSHKYIIKAGNYACEIDEEKMRYLVGNDKINSYKNFIDDLESKIVVYQLLREAKEPKRKKNYTTNTCHVDVTRL